jgi:hypothetical protein
MIKALDCAKKKGNYTQIQSLSPKIYLQLEMKHVTNLARKIHDQQRLLGRSQRDWDCGFEECLSEFAEVK